jgi:hypothetical protein
LSPHSLAVVGLRPGSECPITLQHARVDCVTSQTDLLTLSTRLKSRTLLFDILTEGWHVLRLYDMGAGALVGMVIMPQRKIEMAMARGSIAADDLKIDGWLSAGRRFRWMRTEAGLIVDGLIKGKRSAT